MPEPGGWFRALLIGTLIGGLVGYCELVLFAVRHFGLGHIVYLGPAAVWMTPAADLLLFALIGVGSSLGAIILPAAKRRVAVSVVLMVAASLALLLHLVWIDERAAIVMSLGVGLQAGRVLSRRWDGVSRAARRLVPVMVAVILLVSASVAPVMRWQEGRRLSRLPPPPAEAPNILLLILDTVRALNLGVYGYSRPTSPHLDSLARHGAVFERAYATVSWTLPSHASLFTGREAHEVNAAGLVPLDATHPTLAERLGAAGYATAGFVANQRYANTEWGLARGFGVYEVYPVRLAELPLNALLTRRLINSGRFRRLIGYHDMVNRKRADRVGAELLEWLDRGGERPFFAFLNYFDAHEPYLPPGRFATLFSDAPPAPSRGSAYDTRDIGLDPKSRRALSDVERRRHVDSYDGAIRYVDEEIGKLLEELRQRGVLDRTILVITSDHGEHLGEGGRYLHAFDFFAPVLHVPLIVVYPPGVPAGVRVVEPVSLADVPATLSELAGFGAAFGFPGQTLLPSEPGPDSIGPHRLVFASFKTRCGGKPRFSVIVGRNQYIQDGACGEYLFDVVSDPLALENIIQRPDEKRTAATLQALGTELIERKDPQAP